MFKRNNPLKLIIYWLLLLLVVGIIVIPLLFATTVGGEQKPLTFLIYLLLSAIYGTLILSVITPFFYLDWFKKYWYINLLILIFALVMLFPFLNKVGVQQYDTIEESAEVGNDTIEIKKEYYNSDSPMIIRSESYWKKGKKDSIWTVYTKNGGIISQKEYKDDKLVEAKK